MLPGNGKVIHYPILCGCKLVGAERALLQTAEKGNDVPLEGVLIKLVKGYQKEADARLWEAYQKVC